MSHLNDLLTVNGVPRRIELDDPRVTLLDLLRERPSFDRNQEVLRPGAQCGACHGPSSRDGGSISCLAPCASATTVPTSLTIEGGGAGRSTSSGAKEAFSGPTMACSAGSGTARPDHECDRLDPRGSGPVTIRSGRAPKGMSGNLCRCGAYQGNHRGGAGGAKGARPGQARREVGMKTFDYVRPATVAGSRCGGFRNRARAYLAAGTKPSGPD